MPKKFQGISIILFCTALYGLYGIYARMIALQFGVFAQNWVRNLFVMFLAGILILLTTKTWVRLAKQDLPWVAGWIICDIIFVIAIFISFNKVPIGTALFLLYSGSTIAGYSAGSIFLKEKLTKIKIISMIISFIGLLVIFGAQLHAVGITFLFLGFFTGIVSGLWYIFPKMISHDYPKLQLIVLDGAGILLINLILAVIYKQPVPHLAFSLAWLGLILYGITQLIGDLFVMYGFRLVEAHVGSLVLPFEGIFGTIFAFLIFHETLPITVLLGGLLVLVAALIPNFQKSS